MSNRTINPELVKAQIALLLHQYPELMDDEELRVISLESETDAFDFFNQVLGQIQWTEATASGVKTWIKDLQSRLKALEHREEGLRKLAQGVMESADIKSIPLTLGTMAIKPKPLHVIITDETVIPQDLWRYPDPEPNKALIREMLMRNVPVEGAVLSNQEMTLSIRK
jgi:hypothetical protein